MNFASALPAQRVRTPLTFGQSICVRTTDSLLVILVVWSAFPETLFHDTIRLGLLPLEFVIWYCSLASVFGELILSGGSSRKWSPALIATAISFAVLSIHGILRQAELKWWVIDITHYSGLLFGLYWGLNRDIRQVTKGVVRIGILGAAMLFANIFGLYTGVIPAVNSGRTYTYGMFTASYVTMVCLPILLVNARFSNLSTLGKQVRLFAGVTLIGFLLIGAQLAVTRSMLILTLFVILLSCWVTIKKSDVILYYVAVFTLVLLAVLLGSRAGILADTQMTDRFTGRDLVEEDRYIEVEMMFEDMETQANWWVGKGFGSRFLSCIVVDGEDLALAPHIAILAPLYKGGMFCFALMILFPTLHAIYRLTKFGGSRQQLAFSAGLLVYILASSMSGGWNFLNLFLFGAFWSLSNAKPQASMS